MVANTDMNLIKNGSFEEFDANAAANYTTWWGARSLAGWTLEGVQKDKTNWFEIANSGVRGVNTTSGSKWLDMDASNGNIAVNQTVEGVEAGKSYTLSVKLASSNYGEGVDIYWGGVKLANIVPTKATMETVTFTVTGMEDAALNTLRLVGTGVSNGLGVSIDEVSLVQNADGFFAEDDASFYIDAVHEGTANAQYFEAGAGSGRQFINNFDAAFDHIQIRANLATSWADLQQKATIYQSGASAVIEFHNESEVIILTQFDVQKLGPALFTFDAPAVTTAVEGKNLINNGSFESVGGNTKMNWGYGATVIDGWTLGGTAKTGTNWFEMHSSGVRGVSAADGKYWLDMDASNGNIAVTQAVKGVEAGRYYTVSFSVAASSSGNMVDVFWAGQKIATVTPDGSKMQEFSFVVEGYSNASQNVLSFNSIGAADGYGVSLDNVRMFAHESVLPTPDVFTFGLGSGRMYVTDFNLGFDKVSVRADLASSFDDLMSQASAYQDGRTTIIEFHNGREVIVLPQFDVSQLSADMFTFEKPSRSTDMQGVSRQINGTEKDDVLIAGAGDQTFDGGEGFDIITGGLGADSFIYKATSGHDFIADFNGSEDRIVMSADIAKSFDELLEVGAIYQDGKSTQIEVGEGMMITLYGVDAKTVSADWFIFS
jgi:hypothetical protein